MALIRLLRLSYVIFNLVLRCAAALASLFCPFSALLLTSSRLELVHSNVSIVEVALSVKNEVPLL